MGKWRNNLVKAHDEGQIIRVDRSPEIEDEIDGYVVGISPLLVLLHVFDPGFMNLNGYMVLRVQDIHRYRIRNGGDCFFECALKLKGIRPIPQPKIDLSNFPALLESANFLFPLVTINQEILYSDICFIGRVQKLKIKSVILEEINPSAQWERTRRYRFKDISRIDFGGGYEEALTLVAEHEAKWD